MRVAAAAEHLHALDEQAAIGARSDVLLRDGHPEARPSGARIELRIGAEQRIAAADAPKNTVVVKLIVGSGVRCVRTSFARNVELAGAEELSPLAVGVDHSLHRNRPLLLPAYGEFHEGDF